MSCKLQHIGPMVSSIKIFGLSSMTDLRFGERWLFWWSFFMVTKLEPFAPPICLANWEIHLGSSFFLVRIEKALLLCFLAWCYMICRNWSRNQNTLLALWYAIVLLFFNISTECIYKRFIYKQYMQFSKIYLNLANVHVCVWNDMRQYLEWLYLMCGSVHIQRNFLDARIFWSRLVSECFIMWRVKLSC